MSKLNNKVTVDGEWKIMNKVFHLHPVDDALDVVETA